jgi:hypothetical protein
MRRPGFHDYVSFSDESCTSDHDYMIIGGVLCAHHCYDQIIADLRTLPRTRQDHWDYEWKNIRERNLSKYEDFVDLFFSYNREHCLDFACLVIECGLLDHGTFNDGDGEVGFNKFLFQHLFRYARVLPSESVFRCYHDRRTSRYDLDQLREMLDSKSLGHDGRFVWRYAEVAFADKEDQPLLQFADVLIGAVGFEWNGKHLTTPETPKAKIAKRIRHGAGVSTLAKQTWMSEEHFSIWKFGLSSPRGPSAFKAAAAGRTLRVQSTGRW